MLLAALFASSQLVVTAADAAAPLVRASSLRGAAAAPAAAAPEAAASGRRLQGVGCYKDGGSGVAASADCSSVGSCSAYSCVVTAGAGFGAGQFFCALANGFKVQAGPNFFCPYEWSCCY
jgi:hypothetical protein